MSNTVALKTNGLSMTISGSALTTLVNKLKAPLLSAIENDAAFRQAIVNAIMPQIRQVAAQVAQTTAAGKKP
jgi:hypothetical protein